MVIMKFPMLATVTEEAFWRPRTSAKSHWAAAYSIYFQEKPNV